MVGPRAVTARDTTLGEGRGADLFEALEEHLRRHPEDPALFHPEGLDVRWRSWRALADQAAGGAEALAAAGAAPGAPVAYVWRCHPDAVAADLAIRWIGGTAVPVAAADDAAAADCATRLVLPGERPARGEPGVGPVAVALPEPEAPGNRRRGAAYPPAPEAGGARVVEPALASDRPPALRDLSPGEVIEAARELGARLAAAAAEAEEAAGGARRGREIGLVHLDPLAPSGRAFLSWALLAGAALLLEPDRRAFSASAAWARPTLVAADAPPLVELARQLRRQPEGRLRELLRRGRPRHPFGRLRLLVVLGGGRLPVDDVPFWADRGVVVVRA